MPNNAHDADLMLVALSYLEYIARGEQDMADTLAATYKHADIFKGMTLAFYYYLASNAADNDMTQAEAIAAFRPKLLEFTEHYRNQ